ncbi:hypothetical protein OG539_41050 [Actinacidiphila glaucinigra]|uniref:hypothetical protein n=1 Tax=Actinacidiphila glaucinigra TaxID=235986 RepID=UPI003248A723
MSRNSNGARRAAGFVTAFATAVAIASITPVQASTAQLYVWFDGWGGGTVTSQPAGINCHTTAWDPYATEEPQPNPTGTCAASFEVGTTVTFTATPDTGSHINFAPDPNPVTVVNGYNFTWAMFCPDEGLCNSY